MVFFQISHSLCIYSSFSRLSRLNILQLDESVSINIVSLSNYYNQPVKVSKELLASNAVETQYVFTSAAAYENLRMEQIMVLHGTPIECLTHPICSI